MMFEYSVKSNNSLFNGGRESLEKQIVSLSAMLSCQAYARRCRYASSEKRKSVLVELLAVLRSDGNDLPLKSKDSILEPVGTGI